MARMPLWRVSTYRSRAAPSWPWSGASGSGKTTLLKTINGLIAPDAGEILIERQPAAACATHELRRRIGYVFQEVGLFPHMTVAENIGATPRLLGWEKARTAERVATLLVAMQAANYSVDRDSAKATPAQAARALEAKIASGE